MRKRSKRSFLTFRSRFSDMVLVNWLFPFSLILAVGAWHDIGRRFISEQGFDDKTGGSEERVGKRLDTGDKTKMAGRMNDLHGNISKKINMGNFLGHDWYLVREQEREGQCPGTKEKVGNTE